MAIPDLVEGSTTLPQAPEVPHPELPVIRIRPTTGWVSLRLHDIVAYRELLYFLVWRDVKVRYKQTALGASWAVIQPFFTMLVFSIFFGRLAKVPSDGVPYPVFAYTALVPWTFFATGLTSSANSLVSSSNLITKVYFPRLIVPLATVLAGVVDFVVAFAVLLVLLWFYGVAVPPQVVFLPAFFLLALVATAGVGIWLAALNVEFRDVRYVVPFLTQFWMFATPVAYPSSLLSDRWRTMYALNTMVGVVEGFRWSLLGSGRAPGLMVLVSALASVALLVGGAFYFRRVEKSFADRV